MTLLSLMACQGTKKMPVTSGTSDKPASGFNIDYEKYTLDNGLDVILHQDASDPIVAVAIMFHVGSNREKPGRTGFAHFFEHMLFQNSENVGKGNFFKIIDELGGEFNGGTWNDGTVYYEVLPKDALERILWMESDRMGFLINTVTDPVLQNEKEVVKNEKRQRVDNQPYGHAGYVIGKALYPEDHPYNWQVIGSLEDLQTYTIEDVKEFYELWYGPNNATMVIAGDIDFAEAKAMVDKYFSEIPAKAKAASLTPRPGKIAATRRLTHEDNFAQVPELRLVWPTVEDGHPDSYALSYLGQLLSSGKRAPLYKEVVESRQLAPRVGAFNSTREIAGEFQILVRSNADAKLDAVHEAVFAGLDNFLANGIDDRDMERIKNTLETQFYGGISSLLSKSFQLAQYNEFRGRPDAIEDEISNILAVTKADIMRVYEQYIRNKPYLATSFVPRGKMDLALSNAERAEVVEEPVIQGAEAAPLPEDDVAFEKTPSRIDRSVMPPLGAAPVINLPQIWQQKLANGLQVYGIENNELPLVEFNLTLKGGMLLDDPNKVGVANLITDIMQEGTAQRTPEQLQDAIGELGARISMGTGSESISIEGSCLQRNFPALMAIFEEMLLEPRWDEKEFDRIKQRTINQIQQRDAQSGSIAVSVFNKLLYGQDNILSNSTSGNIATVQAITIDDVKQYYAKHFSPSVSAFHVTGAADQATVLAALKSIEARWAAMPVAMPTLPEPPAIEAPRLYFVDMPEAKQSVIRIGAPAMKGSSPDFYAADFVNQRLGNGTSGRFFQQLREERGYTYGAYSSFPRRVNTSFFAASSSVRANVTLESVQLFKEIMDGYPTDYSQEDLDKTRGALLKSNARAYETLSDKMGILENISTYGLPTDYMKQEEKAILDMDIAKARRMIQRYINPNKMIYLIVGDAKTQASRLTELGLGAPIMLDKEGNVIQGGN